MDPKPRRNRQQDLEYEVRYHCKNCDRNQWNTFKVGKEAPFTVRCDFCGVVKAEKIRDHQFDPPLFPAPLPIDPLFPPRPWRPGWPNPPHRGDPWCPGPTPRRRPDITWD